MLKRNNMGSTLSEFTPESIAFITQTLREHNFELIERIGYGGFSMIFKVKSLRIPKFYAAKVLNTASVRHSNHKATFKNERKALSHLSHPNIIKLVDNFEAGKFVFLVLELCGQKTLEDVIKSGTSTITDRVMYMKQLLHALVHIHSMGYVHRDIKPANVLFDDYGRVKLADFGLCIKWPTNGEKSSEFLGSPHFMAPEIFRREPFDPYKADIYSLGVTFYELCGGTVNWPASLDIISAIIGKEGFIVHHGTKPDVTKIVISMTKMKASSRPSLFTIARQPLFHAQRKAMQAPVPATTRTTPTPIRKQSAAKVETKTVRAKKVTTSELKKPKRRRSVQPVYGSIHAMKSSFS
ncbi:CAMK family protein kinase [Tritrichomonas foetus]|uniref:CAMK family protein kinase n=1 Tax=Tritrichomonas foetus TaxID=1144522 RepID=A0A1J4KN99_9EUKA|nr:CAMK family protein kinase [Tritrichomonas foetus]|eukprot:OHT12594.1 CAMK family protein kinase [Tritrichomonas foetus]